ncbi:MAG: hypothetical protein ACI35P_12260 [Bacillus sp. (in: firmicutes)]
MSNLREDGKSYYGVTSGGGSVAGLAGDKTISCFNGYRSSSLLSGRWRYRLHIGNRRAYLGDPPLGGTLGAALSVGGGAGGLAVEGTP